MGFLDKNNRIIDMVLTGYGKELFSKGELRFVYWAAFDDEVDYDPYVAESGSLTEEALAAKKFQLIEDTIVREATTGYRRVNRSGSDTTNVHRPLFDMPQGQVTLPAVTSSAPSEVTLEVTQQKVVETLQKRDAAGTIVETMGPYDRGYTRTNPSSFHLEYGYQPGAFPSDAKLEGFLVRVFESGSEGLVQIDERRDSNNEVSFNNDLVLTRD